MAGCQEHLEPTLSPGGPGGPAGPASPLEPLFPSSPLGPGGPWAPAAPYLVKKIKKGGNRKKFFMPYTARGKSTTVFKVKV